MEPLLRAIERIEDRLAEPLTVQDIARAAGFSRYHFCRYFRAMTGESVMGYIRARRLSIAAIAIRDGGDRLIDIAFDAGFDSQQAFTRAFRRAFGLTPGALRRGNGSIDRAGLKPSLSEDWLRARQEAIPMEPTMKSCGPLRIAGLRQRMSRGNANAIPELWKTLHARMDEFENAIPGAAYGVCLHAKNGGPGDFDYMAGLRVKEGGPLPDGMEVVTLPAREYAVFTFSPETTDLPREFRKAYAYIFETWLPGSDFKIAQAADFEHYDQNRFSSKTLSGEIDIYLPVEPKTP